MLLGALIGSKINNIFFAIILAFLSHYFLDTFPHIEYPIENIVKKQWRKALPDFSRVILDFCLGILLIALLSNNHPIIYICAFFAILPDGFSILDLIFKNKLLREHSKFHQEKIHTMKNKKFSKFWRISSQVVAGIICIILLKI